MKELISKENTPIQKSQDRLDILKKIEEYENNGWFDRDVEQDPPTVPLKAGQVDYCLKKFSSKLKTKFANFVAYHFYEKRIKRNELIIKNVIGLENVEKVKGGAVLTCNHFSPNDNYAVYRPLRKWLKKRDLYKVIREGNYTSYKGIYGFFFRNCNTLPLGSSREVLKEFFASVDELLKRGEVVLIYPEQAMWWNYKKPRPLKSGAFRIATKSNVPILPAFITMQDSQIVGSDGFFVQEYTIHYLPPIYPDPNLSEKENCERMMEENSRLWQKSFEETYKSNT